MNHNIILEESLGKNRYKILIELLPESDEEIRAITKRIMKESSEEENQLIDDYIKNNVKPEDEVLHSEQMENFFVLVTEKTN